MAQWMVDTNLILRSVQPESEQYAEARGAIDTLASSGHAMCVVPQVVAEFWSVATRPSDVNGLGWTIPEVVREVNVMMSRFVLLRDMPAAFPIWFDLVQKHEVKGKKVHDARLAALMQAHGVDSLLTFNTADFSAFEGIKAVHPRDVV